MTLIIGCGNRHHTTLVSDRRLTVNGSVQTDESNKATTLVCADARLAASYTGLARAGRFRTEQWLLEALLEAAPPDFSMPSLLERFKERAQEKFGSLAIARVDKRISFVLAGYFYGDDPPRPCFWLISNFEDGFMEGHFPEAQDDFMIRSYREKRPAQPLAYAFAEGHVSGVDKVTFEELRTAANNTSHWEPLVGKSLNVLREAAASPKSGGVVGTQAMSVVIPSDLASPPHGEYHTTVNSCTTYFPNQVIALPDNQMAMMGAEFSADVTPGQPPPGPVAVPKVGRNHPCPCGSGKKYKVCHGRRFPTRGP